MALPPDLLGVLWHMWLGAIPLVAGAGALGAVQLWARLGPRLAARRRAARIAALRARLAPAYFARATVAALRSATPEAGGVRARLLLTLRTTAGDLPALADWLVAPDALALAQPGQEVDVLVIAGRPRRALPNVAWASDAAAPAAAPQGEGAAAPALGGAGR